jgi:hypothetical protein
VRRRAVWDAAAQKQVTSSQAHLIDWMQSIEWQLIIDSSKSPPRTIAPNKERAEQEQPASRANNRLRAL